MRILSLNKILTIDNEIKGNKLYSTYIGSGKLIHQMGNKINHMHYYVKLEEVLSKENDSEYKRTENIEILDTEFVDNKGILRLPNEDTLIFKESLFKYLAEA